MLCINYVALSAAIEVVRQFAGQAKMRLISQ